MRDDERYGWAAWDWHGRLVGVGFELEIMEHIAQLYPRSSRIEMLPLHRVEELARKELARRLGETQ